jgi:hypothetical protein
MVRNCLKVLAAGLGLLAYNGTDAMAQVCAGFPTASGQAAAALTTGHLTGSNSFGVEAGFNLPGDFAVFGGVQHNPSNLDGISGATSAGIGGSYQSPALSALVPLAQVCPMVSVNAASVQDLGVLSIPVGVGFGTTATVGGMSVMPYAVPQLRFMTGAGDVSSDFLLSFGTLIGFGDRFYVGGSVNRIFVEGADSEFGLKLGVTF